MVQAIPLFLEAHVLRKTMLEALSDYAFLTNKYLYKGYADGILAGCELTTTRDLICLNEGIVFYEGQPFLIKETMSATYAPSNETRLLVMRFDQEQKDANFIYRQVEIYIIKEDDIQKNDLELCRFKLQEGAVLRHQYQDFEDRNTEFDTLNIIYAPYAAKEEATLSPEITRNFAEEMLQIKEISDFDALFCLQLLGQDRPVSKKALIAYLKRKQKIEYKDTQNNSVYQGLLSVLKKAKGIDGPETEVQKKKWKMML